MADSTSSSFSNGDTNHDEELLHSIDTMSFLDHPNTEEYHTAMLEAVRLRHLETYEDAQRALQIYHDREQAKLLKARADALEKSVAAAEKKAQEDIRIREAENRARQIPQPPPKLRTPPPRSPPAVQRPTIQPSAPIIPPAQAPTPTVSTPAIANTQPTPTPQPAALPIDTQPIAAPAPTQATQPPQSTSQSTPIPQPSAPSVQPPQQQTQSQPESSVTQINPSHILPDGPRYVQIHADCKRLRQYINTLTDKTMNIPTGTSGNKQHSVKTLAGDLRRALTRTMGQLTDGAGTNMEQLKAIRGVLTQAYNAPSPGMDPRRFLVSFPSEPVEGAKNNGEEMPCLFLYIVNIFAKAVARQLCNEAGVNPRIAEPIGVVVHNVITTPDFLWRGKTFMDIIIAKFRTSLPVVFGERGSEKTEEGRARLGWKKDGDSWISEQEHFDRMRGLGAGYAALCLRNYSKSARTNPWPPSNYWNAMGLIVNTPPAERSATQTLVLTSLIDGFEKKFLEFYGDMALCALSTALIEFPNKSPDQSPAVKTLIVLGDRLKKDMGLALRA